MQRWGCLVWEDTLAADNDYDCPASDAPQEACKHAAVRVQEGED